MDKAAAFRRAADFMMAVEERSYTRKEPWSLGSAFFHDEYPVKWVLNFLRIEHDDPSIPADAIAKEADRIMGARGLSHRMIHTDDANVAARLQPGLEALGWDAERLLVMSLADAPPISHTPGIEVKELSQVEMYDIAKAAYEHQFPEQAVHSDELARSRAVTIQAADAISLGASIGGKVAGFCDFYDGGDTGQIEEVNTFERYRNRGVAKALVTTAIDLSKRRGHDLTFLVADADDWPKELYRRLGFEPVGYIYEFRRTEKNSDRT